MRDAVGGALRVNDRPGPPPPGLGEILGPTCGRLMLTPTSPTHTRAHTPVQLRIAIEKRVQQSFLPPHKTSLRNLRVQYACRHACMRATLRPRSVCFLHGELDHAAAAQSLEALSRPPTSAARMSRQTAAQTGGAAAAGSSGVLAHLMLSGGLVGVTLSSLIQQHSVPSVTRPTLPRHALG